MQASNSSPDGSAAPAQRVLPWLELPDPCLLAVLRCCAATDTRTLLSAARAHSRLRQVAALVDSIQADIRKQWQLYRLLLYLSKRGQHVRSINLRPRRAGDRLFYSPTITLCELPVNLPRLHSLSLTQFCLQLQPGSGHRGVLSGAVGALLKRLELKGCRLLDGPEGLAAALQQLPGLEHLRVDFDLGSNSFTHDLTVGWLLGVQQLTSLELSGTEQHPQWGASLQYLSALTRLADLRLSVGPVAVTPGMLAGAQQLTRLQLDSNRESLTVNADVLAGRTQLQHLELRCDLTPGGSAGAAALLHQLQQLQQLTVLVISRLPRTLPDRPPAAAFSALTASSKLRVLAIASCNLPGGVWQHVFPASRQLPHLTALDVSGIHMFRNRAGTRWPAVPDGSQLVSCCPALQTLTLGELPAGLTALTQLTGLRELELSHQPDGQLLRLTCLKQLTRLCWNQPWEWPRHTLICQAPGAEPVWRQLLWRLSNSWDHEVARQAAVRLAGLALEPQARGTLAVNSRC